MNCPEFTKEQQEWINEKAVEINYNLIRHILHIKSEFRSMLYDAYFISWAFSIQGKQEESERAKIQFDELKHCIERREMDSKNITRQTNKFLKVIKWFIVSLFFLQIIFILFGAVIPLIKLNGVFNSDFLLCSFYMVFCLIAMVHFARKGIK